MPGNVATIKKLNKKLDHQYRLLEKSRDQAVQRCKEVYENSQTARNRRAKIEDIKKEIRGIKEKMSNDEWAVYDKWIENQYH